VVGLGEDTYAPLDCCNEAMALKIHPTNHSQAFGSKPKELTVYLPSKKSLPICWVWLLGCACSLPSFAYITVARYVFYPRRSIRVSLLTFSKSVCKVSSCSEKTLR
jgi:hypothetical protein